MIANSLRVFLSTPEAELDPATWQWAKCRCESIRDWLRIKNKKKTRPRFWFLLKWCCVMWNTLSRKIFLYDFKKKLFVFHIMRLLTKNESETCLNNLQNHSMFCWTLPLSYICETWTVNLDLFSLWFLYLLHICTHTFVFVNMVRM